MSSALSFTPIGGTNPPVSLRSNSVAPAGFTFNGKPSIPAAFIAFCSGVPKA